MDSMLAHGAQIGSMPSEDEMLSCDCPFCAAYRSRLLAGSRELASGGNSGSSGRSSLDKDAGKAEPGLWGVGPALFSMSC